MFEREAEHIKSILKDELVQIYHIGSTSIPNMWAKPIIDMLVEVKDINKIDQLNDQLFEFGYEPKGEYGIPNRRYFPKGGDNRAHHLHMFPKGDENVNRHLAFRDFLRHHDEEARKYIELKKHLARKYHNSPKEYVAGKNNLIQDLEKKALLWFSYKNN